MNITSNRLRFNRYVFLRIISNMPKINGKNYSDLNDKFYDSQSGRFMKSTGTDGISLHDLSLCNQVWNVDSIKRKIDFFNNHSGNSVSFTSFNIGKLNMNSLNEQLIIRNLRSGSNKDIKYSVSIESLDHLRFLSKFINLSTEHDISDFLELDIDYQNVINNNSITNSYSPTYNINNTIIADGDIHNDLKLLMTNKNNLSCRVNIFIDINKIINENNNSHKIIFDITNLVAKLCDSEFNVINFSVVNTNYNDINKGNIIFIIKNYNNILFFKRRRN